MNERRGYGLCALTDRQCVAGEYSNAAWLVGRHTSEAMGCAVFHQMFNNERDGFITGLASCIAYAERFGQLDCYDEDGNAVHTSPR